MASRKYTTSHEGRGRSNYPNRRGMYSHGHMPELDNLRAKQANRIKDHGHPWPVEFGAYNGPFTFTVDDNHMPIAILPRKGALDVMAE